MQKADVLSVKVQKYIDFLLEEYELECQEVEIPERDQGQNWFVIHLKDPDAYIQMSYYDESDSYRLSLALPYGIAEQLMRSFQEVEIDKEECLLGLTDLSFPAIVAESEWHYLYRTEDIAALDQNTRGTWLRLVNEEENFFHLVIETFSKLNFYKIRQASEKIYDLILRCWKLDEGHVAIKPRLSISGKPDGVPGTLVTSYDEALQNAVEFSKIDRQTASIAYRRFAQFFHWYYFPEHDIFAPSKFIGYKNTNVSSYLGGNTGNGGITETVLNKYFDKLDKNSSTFKKLYESLVAYSDSIGRKVSARIVDGPGAIHVPKDFQANQANQDTQITRTVKQLEALFEEALDDDNEALQVLVAKVRKGQPKFRRNLMVAYGGLCVLSDHGPEEVLEAAHILPHAESGINKLDNGLLMRADIHSLFDAHLIKIDPMTLKVLVDPSLHDIPCYRVFHGKVLRARKDGSQVSRKYLQKRWDSIT